MSGGKKVQVYILSHERPFYLREAIDSVLKQSRFDLIDLVVSDNSRTDDVEHMVRSEYPFIAYVRRIPAVSAADHFKAVLSDVKAPYFMLFHDDDIMLPGMIGRLYEEISSSELICAVAPNAYLKMRGFVGRCCVRPRSNLWIYSPRDLFLRYCLLQGVAPFPGYLYRTSVYQSNLGPLSSPAGKYSDVTFVASGLEKGNVLWLSEPLMFYRRHPTNDSALLDPNAREGLISIFYADSVPLIARLIYKANDEFFSLMKGRGRVYGIDWYFIRLLSIPLFVIPLTILRKIRSCVSLSRKSY